MSDGQVNPYELLELSVEATEQEIRSAYRQRSLKVHPDRNINNPDAARKFHELNQAHELLLDPLRRLALDAKLRLKEAQKARLGKHDVKRRVLVEELEERERAFKKARMDKQKEEVDRWRETERIKEEGRRLREEKEKAISKAEEETTAAAENMEETDVPTLGTFDTTVRLKYSLATHPNLTTSSALSSLLSPFGETDTASIVFSAKPPKKAPHKPPIHGIALVPFKQIYDAFSAVCASGAAERGLEGIEVGWAEKKEPQILGWLRRMGKLSTPTTLKQNIPPTSLNGDTKARVPQAQTRTDSSTFSSFPESFPEPLRPSTKPQIASVGGLDYEALTLLRLRQAERDRLAQEIRQQEGDE